jgi:thymidylate kinase
VTANARGLAIAVEGPSGVGKSTVTRLLGRSRNSVRLEEAWDRLSPQPSLELGSRRELLALERKLLEVEAERYAQARRAADEGHTVWMDTGTMGPLTYSAGLAWLTGGALDLRRPLLAWARRALGEGRWGLPDLIVHLELAPSEILARGLRSGRHPPTLLARHLLVARFESELYRNRIARCLPHRVLPMRARGSPEELARSVERKVRARPRPPPPAQRETDSVLRALEGAMPPG